MFNIVYITNTWKVGSDAGSVGLSSVWYKGSVVCETNLTQFYHLDELISSCMRL